MPKAPCSVFAPKDASAPVAGSTTASESTVLRAAKNKVADL